MKVFVADDVNEAKLAPLSDAGIRVEKGTKLTHDELAVRLSDADGLIVRSATKVTAELLESAPKLRVIGRAGVGTDNIDSEAATERGIVVMNAPDGNTITTAEHTFAMIASLARNIPAANAKLNSGTWEKKAFVGVELCNKTLGIIGLGRIGKYVSKIANGFGMKVLAFDPFVTEIVAEELGISIGTIDDVFRTADFITVHTPLTDETRGLINKATFGKMKQGVRLINCARGGLVNEADLVEAIEIGKVAGAALDVFETEPPDAISPLLNNPKVIVTPHLGASTIEAQEGVAQTVAEQIRDFLLYGEIRNAINVPAMAASDIEFFKPFIELARQAGRFQAQILELHPVSAVRFSFVEKLSNRENSPIIRAFLTGLLKGSSTRVNDVNSLVIARERGINIEVDQIDSVKRTNADFMTSVFSGEQVQTVCGKVYESGEGRLTQVGDFLIEAVPKGNMLYTRSKDCPGVIGKIGSILGANGSNIARFYLGRDFEGGEALAIIELDAEPEPKLIAELLEIDAVIAVKPIKL
ncbi:MAG: phosphoglycerate dehydrogenase [Pyrinomonadaceae bacterium]